MNNKKIMCRIAGFTALLALGGCGVQPVQPTEQQTIGEITLASEQELYALEPTDSGSIALEPNFEPDLQPTQKTEAANTGAITDGWWVRPENYQSEGLSLVDYFTLDEAGNWIPYNCYGEEGTFLEYTYDGEILSLDAGFGPFECLCRDGEIIDPESGTVEFIQVFQSPFQEVGVTLDGRWYLIGVTHQPTYYEITGKSFQKVTENYGDPYVLKEGTYTVNNVQQYQGDYLIPDLLKIETGDFEPELIPSGDGTILFEEDNFDSCIYVHESALDPDMEFAYSMMNGLMNMDLRSELPNDSFQQTYFYPNYFSIATYVPDGDTGYQEDGARIWGQWEFCGTKEILLSFDSGEQEMMKLPNEGETFTIQAVNGVFELDPFYMGPTVTLEMG